jgi:hypothetical protein
MYTDFSVTMFVGDFCDHFCALTLYALRMHRKHSPEKAQKHRPEKHRLKAHLLPFLIACRKPHSITCRKPHFFTCRKLHFVAMLLCSRPVHTPAMPWSASRCSTNGMTAGGVSTATAAAAVGSSTRLGGGCYCHCTCGGRGPPQASAEACPKRRLADGTSGSGTAGGGGRAGGGQDAAADEAVVLSELKAGG